MKEDVKKYNDKIAEEKGAITALYNKSREAQTIIGKCNEEMIMRQEGYQYMKKN